MTKQEMFDRVWDHFITKKNRRSTIEPGHTVCRYRGPNGLKCAAGLFVPDACYSPDMEGCSPGILDPSRFEEGVDINFLGELQRTHDHALDETLYTRLIELAHDHKLAVPWDKV